MRILPYEEILRCALEGCVFYLWRRRLIDCNTQYAIECHSALEAVTFLRFRF
ncbi:MAG: hypothetical protein ACPGWR_26365 [Ardenticatenaceae bacterium]